MLKALGHHLRNWLNFLSSIQTALLLVGAFGGAWLITEIAHAFGNVAGHWLWIEAIGAFLLFASTFVLVQQQELAKNPPLPTKPPVHLPPPPLPRLNARLKQFGTRIAYVDIPLDHYYFEETRGGSKRALLAVFENEVHGAQATGEAKTVTGRIRYSDAKGAEVGEFRVQEGCWLQASAHEINFPPNAKHELIIAIRDYSQSHVVRVASRYSAGVKNTTFDHKKLYVEVSLISKGETLITGHYILNNKDGDFSLKQVES